MILQASGALNSTICSGFTGAISKRLMELFVCFRFRLIMDVGTSKELNDLLDFSAV